MTDTTETPRPATPSEEPAGPAPPPDHSDSWHRLAPILAVLAAAIILSIATDTFPVVAFIFAVIAMVMIHEAGHFITAKWSGMKVTEFFFGFGPRLWAIRRGETEYGVKALPVGGYVKIIGMSNVERNIDPADEPRTYRQQSFPKRMAVALAGVATHFVVGFLLLLMIWSVVGVPNWDRPTTQIAEISRLRTGESPAERAGFEVGDRIVSVQGQPVSTWGQVPPLIRRNANQPIDFVVERDGRRVSLTAVPTEIEREGQRVGFIGLGPAPSMETVSPVVGAGRAAGDLWELTVVSVKAFGSFFSIGNLRDYAGQLTDGPRASRGDPVDEGDGRFLSIVGVVRIAGQAAESGWFNVLYLLVLLNIFVGVFNLVPLLPLDGGHVAIAVYERLRSLGGRRYYADVSKMVPVAAVVVTVLVAIGISALWLDIVRPLSNPFQ